VAAWVCRWRSPLGSLEEENDKLKRVFADAMLDVRPCARCSKKASDSWVEENWRDVGVCFREAEKPGSASELRRKAAVQHVGGRAEVHDQGGTRRQKVDASSNFS
jgi:hypothetical protein